MHGSKQHGTISGSAAIVKLLYFAVCLCVALEDEERA